MSRRAFSSDSSMPCKSPRRAVRLIYASGGNRAPRASQRLAREYRGIELLILGLLAAVELLVVEVAVTILVGGGEGFHELRIDRCLRHRDASVPVGVQSVERAALASRCRGLRLSGFGGNAGQRQQGDHGGGEQFVVHGCLLCEKC